MRPVILQLEGFASFRAATQVDFTDADFFALVGPTGSGKSTVIDAMTFALYGSVPRWGRKGMVSLALAPTTVRGTVKLVFEAGGQRYVVARELRRVGGQVSQRAASLERIATPGGLAEPGAPTEPMAKDRGVADAVERLLGLSYEDFCQCVVLPQGQFAAFLHAKASERQEILLRLLGAERYQQIMKKANQRASEATQRAAALTETLTAFDDATQDAEAAARQAEAALAALGDRMSSALPGIHSATQELAAAEDELSRLEREKATLAGVQIPGHVAQLDTDLAAARVAREQFRAAERDAEQADTTARQALAAGPQRAPLERIRGLRDDQETFRAERPVREAEASRLAESSRQAEALVTAATTEREHTRGQRDDAASRAATAAQTVRDLAATHTALTAVEMPDGIAELSHRVRAAAETRHDAQTHLDQAEHAESQARAALPSAADPVLLERVAGANWLSWPASWLTRRPPSRAPVPTGKRPIPGWRRRLPARSRPSTVSTRRAAPIRPPTCGRIWCAANRARCASRPSRHCPARRTS
jgi:DNA repair protein SbcC/Rad50